MNEPTQCNQTVFITWCLVLYTCTLPCSIQAEAAAFGISWCPATPRHAEPARKLELFLFLNPKLRERKKPDACQPELLHFTVRVGLFSSSSSCWMAMACDVPLLHHSAAVTRVLVIYFIKYIKTRHSNILSSHRGQILWKLHHIKTVAVMGP